MPKTQPTLEDWKAEAEKWNRLAIKEREDKEAWRDVARGLTKSLERAERDLEQR